MVKADPSLPAVGEPCAECGGRTIEFSGKGNDMQYKICSRWKERGHLRWDEVQNKYIEMVRAVRPSGRFA